MDLLTDDHGFEQVIELRFKKRDLIWFFLFYKLADIIDTAGFDKYVILMGVSVFFLIYRKDTIKRNNIYILLPGITYVFFGFISNMISGFYGFHTVKDGILAVASSVLALFLYEDVLDHRINICKVMLIGFGVYSFSFFLKSPDMLTRESTQAFIYGAFIIYFLINDEWNYVFLSILLCLFSDKRIALMGVAVAVCYIVFFVFASGKEFSRTKTIFTVTIVLTVIMTYYLTYTLHGGILVKLFSEYGVNFNGRDKCWENFRDLAEFDLGFVGRGMGFVKSKLEIIGNNDYLLLHSDLYNAYIDLGFIGFGAWISSYFWAFYNLTKRSANKAKLFAITVVIYTFVIYLTDNALIYIDYWLPLNIILLDISNRDPCVKNDCLRLRNCAVL